MYPPPKLSVLQIELAQEKLSKKEQDGKSEEDKSEMIKEASGGRAGGCLSIKISLTRRPLMRESNAEEEATGDVEA